MISNDLWKLCEIFNDISKRVSSIIDSLFFRLKKESNFRRRKFFKVFFEIIFSFFTSFQVIFVVSPKHLVSMHHRRDNIIAAHEFSNFNHQLFISSRAILKSRDSREEYSEKFHSSTKSAKRKQRWSSHTSSRICLPLISRRIRVTGAIVWWYFLRFK